MRAKDIYETWFNRVWADGDLDAIDSFVAPSSQASGLMTDMVADPEDIKSLVLATRPMLRDIACFVDLAIDAPPWHWGLIRIEAYAAKTMKPVTITGQVMGRIDGDRLVEIYNNFDMVGFFEQIEAFPADTTALVLTGETFH